MTYSACLMHKVEEMFRQRRGALSRGSDAAGQRDAGKLPDFEGAGPRPAGDAAPESWPTRRPSNRSSRRLSHMRLNRRVLFQFAGAGLAALAGGSLAAADPAAVLDSSHAAGDVDLTADPKNAFWSAAPHVTADHNYLGQPIPGAPMVIRSRWSDQHLYLMYTCPYEELNLKPDPNPCCRDPAVMELGCCRSLHRLRLRTHRPLQGVSGVAAE